MTTPESLSLLLSREQSRKELQDVAYVVCDEWHELIGTKRGVQVQLALARLRRFKPGTGHVGPERHAGKFRARHGGTVRPAASPTPVAGAWPDRQTAGDRHAHPAQSGSLLVGWPPGGADAGVRGG